MPRILTLDEMLQVFIDNKWEGQHFFRQAMEMIGDAMAKTITEKLGITATDAEYEDTVYVAFNPTYMGQRCPAELLRYDTESGWGEDAEDEVVF